MTALLFDFARVILFPKDTSYASNLNALHRKLSADPTYNPLDHFILNTELLAYLDGFKEKTELYIFTSETMQGHPAFAPYLSPFKKIFSASELNMTKVQPEAYTFVASRIGTTPKEITFIDDKKENVEAAIEAGMNGILYISNGQLLEELTKKRSVLF